MKIKIENSQRGIENLNLNGNLINGGLKIFKIELYYSPPRDIG